MDLHPASERILILSVDSWYRSWNKLQLVGLGMCGLPVTNFSAQNIFIQILANLSRAFIECGLKIGCSQGNAIL